MRVLDSETAAWFLLEDGADLLLDVNCNSSAFGYSVLIKLDPGEVAEYRSAGAPFLSRLADRVQDTGPRGEYQSRNVSSRYGDRVTLAVLASRVAWLAGTRWYVPVENLLAYLADPTLSRMTPVADQTIWSIDTAAEGRFQGTSQTQLWVRGPDGSFHPMSSASNAMDGTISPDGEITIVFTPDDPDQAQTTGYGHLRRVDDEWRMEMQMATGTQSLALHWAYMTRAWGDAAPPAPPADLSLDADLRAGEWRWLRGSAWSAVDEALFPGGAEFTIGSYRNGYCWGEGTTADGATLRMAGSVTPEGSLYLLFSVADAPAEARRGTLAMSGDAWRMTWSPPSGGAPTGGAVPVR